MNVNIERIKAHYVYGNFSLVKVESGLRFYPIQYEGDKYTVEIDVSCCNYFKAGRLVDLEYDITGCIYKYSDNGLRKHRSAKLWWTNINDIITNVTKIQRGTDGLKIGSYRNVIKLLEEDLMHCYPAIICGLFNLYDAYRSREQKLQENILEARKWDGVVK